MLHLLKYKYIIHSPSELMSNSFIKYGFAYFDLKVELCKNIA